MKRFNVVGIIFLTVTLLLAPFLGRGFLSTYRVKVLEDAELEYNIYPCDDCEPILHHWDDGVINVSLVDYGLVFDQTLSFLSGEVPFLRYQWKAISSF